ncbi:uncharacterized protein OCT59_028409 [Rhizophagus irregularis]|uniref:Uncharacterized protein n=1 Tax=Rhizophagus irregularis (strain DAOM 181602 / DAOM 197198 / MUCL 43194) TaxID=747089 RepID=A0A2P4PAE7_RHIID|nr:hypothetical protein GLOIN_2v1785361 [Rhizophagus irregularis DAOM 181602=DAOM 197198]PKY19559.1 hypothetical protein RhiirB3_432639 [Rhizophagus irregularis]PKY21052.1 hypothetical protein RhiirB3_434545 [Rhizophagus irregularis]POG62372.1 hypothetical protein GLOIN_2v1785361 [Rhizophagus irregularis DAOM 181602=DAOM 197198]UZO08145.1 hypothetical protein OCT59_028409 [Rhizophagus irregularis]CAB4393151.1 unnamed protein product [Rhizophagus irregularis]|eukprot:XP_025169238.1 hypothetical protein GLOIN_2v1785361 [Rhizophagus irregularis DAOM 181602=DAOM 197198]
MSNILYNNQHKLNQKPIYDPTAFKKMLETADENLIGFFDELYIGTRAPNESILKHIGSYLQTSGTSSSSIDILANIGFSITRKTVNRQKALISESHQDTINNYCLQNIENMFILNIDNYHNIH